MAEEEKPVKKKRPTAQKRDITSGKRYQINKAFKSKVATAMRDFTSLVQSDRGGASAKLSTVYSLLDQAVARGIFKKNKASRLKERASKKVSSFTA